MRSRSSICGHNLPVELEIIRPIRTRSCCHFVCLPCPCSWVDVNRHGGVAHGHRSLAFDLGCDVEAFLCFEHSMSRERFIVLIARQPILRRGGSYQRGSIVLAWMKRKVERRLREKRLRSKECGERPGASPDWAGRVEVDMDQILSLFAFIDSLHLIPPSKVKITPHYLETQDGLTRHVNGLVYWRKYGLLACQGMFAHPWCLCGSTGMEEQCQFKW